MDINESAEMSAFRESIKEWVAQNWSDDMLDAFDYTGLEEPPGVNEWNRRLAKKQWLAFRWPVEFHGSGFTPAQQIVFADELRNCGAIIPRGFGLNMVGPLILQFGSDWQKERFLGPIARDEEAWCQGYSEPNAGSDLASLQTWAERQGDEFIVNGQKIWTSRANLADWIFALVRTSKEGPPQKGISFVLIDMKTPGVSIRPIKQIDGLSGFFETFFEDVRVPVKNMVGEINQGWSVAKALLAHERATTGEQLNLPLLVRRIKSLALKYERDGKPVLEDLAFRDRLAALEMDVDSLRHTRYRLMTAMMQGKAPGPEASIFKLHQSDISQALHDLALEAMGPDAMRWYDRELGALAYDLPMQMTITRAMSIYAGSNEIQRNIIAKRVLSLPD